MQTVTWLLRGNVLHRDSLGNEQLIRQGQLNLMTSGRGIAHAESQPFTARPCMACSCGWRYRTPAATSKPAFEHHGQLPQTSVGGFAIGVLIGDLAGASSATAFSPIVGAQLSAAAGSASCILPLRADYEHVLFVATGKADVEGALLRPGQLYLPAGRHEMAVARQRARLVLLGGEPGEQLLMWWNLVARTPEEIGAAAAACGGRFRAGRRLPGSPCRPPPLDLIRLRRPR